MKELRWRIAQFFENYWWKNYLKNKSPQNYLTWKKEYWQRFLKEINIHNNTIKTPLIDVGCGPAGIFCIFENEAVTALDPLLNDYDKLPIFDRESYTNVKFETVSFENFTPNIKYKTIFCLNAINHFIDIDKSFDKLHQICEDKGQLILSIDAHNFQLFRKLFAFLPLDILHPHQYNLEEYIDFLTSKGFDIVSKTIIKKEFFFNYWVIVANKK